MPCLLWLLTGVFAGSSTDSETSAWSCQKYGCKSGNIRGRGCQCNPECVERQNCCADYVATCSARRLTEAATTQYDTSWMQLISGSACPTETQLTQKNGRLGGQITCQMTSDGSRHFRFPVGEFDISEQVYVPARTTIEGNANPNDPVDKAKKPDPATQTYFIATKGVSDPDAAYCGSGNNMRPGDAQKLRIGFLLNSNTKVKNINFQGKDTTRPLDNGSLCGGAAFETPGCVSPGFCDGPGQGFVGRNGCFDHAGRPNNLVTGDGKGVENVVIENVRLNDLFLPSDARQLRGAQGTQIAVWVAQTQDGSATHNVNVSNLVSMLTRGDGINFHGNVYDSIVENSHIENSGDDVYAIWGGYHSPRGITFRNNVAKNPGVTRDYGYGVCLAVYGAQDATVTGLKCYDRRDWNPGQVPRGDDACQHGPFCNSCLAYVHDNWFGAVYSTDNALYLHDNEYLYMDAPTETIIDRPQIRTEAGSRAKIITAPLTR